MQHCGMLCCKICNHSVFNKESFIVEHAKLHVEKSYECQMCSLKCSSRDIVVLHLQTFHEVTSGTVAEQFIDEIISCSIGEMREKCFPSIKQEDGTVYAVAKLTNVALERRSTAFIPNVYQVGSRMRPITIDDEPQPILQATGDIGSPLYNLPPETVTNPNNYPILEKIRTVDSVKQEEAEEEEKSQQIQSHLHGVDTVIVDDGVTVPGHGQSGTPVMVNEYDIDREDEMEIHLRPSEEVTPTRPFSSSEQVADIQDDDLTHLSQNSSIVTPPPRTPSGRESVISNSPPAPSRVLRERSTPTPAPVSVRRSSGKTETAPPKCPISTPLEDKLFEYKLEQVDSKYARWAIRLFEKRQERNGLRFLVEALESRESSTSCVNIRPFRNGRNYVQDGEKLVVLPQWVSARVWRWPDVTSGELQQLCCDTDSFVRNLVCINPFHYERVSPGEKCHPIVRELLKYHKKGEPVDFARTVITYLVKKLRNNGVALDALMTAVKDGKSNTECVTVRGLRSGRFRIYGVRRFAYLIYSSIWRFPKVKKTDLRKSRHCTTSSEDPNVVCVNPYHYDRCVEKKRKTVKRVVVNEGESVDGKEGGEKKRRVD